MITTSAVHITFTGVHTTGSELNVEMVQKTDGQAKNRVIGNLISKENGG